MYPFEYNTFPTRVIFGSGALSKIASEIDRQNLQRPLVISTPQQIAQALDIQSLLDGKVAGVFSEAVMHTPVEVTEKAISYIQDLKGDCVISVGGGSTIGLGKAICIRTGLPHVCIPTTYAGSEMTPILGETANSVKVTRSDPKILPGTVIYDTDLTMSLPSSLSAISGVNAIAHAVEALYAENSNPIISLLALEGISSLVTSIPVITKDISDISAREKALYGAWLCGTCLGAVGMALHHKLCHTLGGSFNLPHAEIHTILLPHTLSYNAPAIPDVMAKLAAVIPESDGDAVNGLNILLKKLGVQKSLKELGMKAEDISRATDLALQKQYPNPRKIERAPLEELIRRAWAGEDARGNQ